MSWNLSNVIFTELNHVAFMQKKNVPLSGWFNEQKTSTKPSLFYSRHIGLFMGLFLRWCHVSLCELSWWDQFPSHKSIFHLTTWFEQILSTLEYILEALYNKIPPRMMFTINILKHMSNFRDFNQGWVIFHSCILTIH